MLVSFQDLAGNQTLDGTASNGLDETSFSRFRTRDGNQSAKVSNALVDQTTNHNHIRTFDRPDDFTLVDRFDLVDLHTHITCRMRSFKFNYLYT